MSVGLHLWTQSKDVDTDGQCRQNDLQKMVTDTDQTKEFGAWKNRASADDVVETSGFTEAIEGFHRERFRDKQLEFGIAIFSVNFTVLWLKVQVMTRCRPSQLKN